MPGDGGITGELADPETIKAWIAAATSGGVCEGLESAYRSLAGDIARRAPVCRTSGRCCRFESWGHRLYVTGLEAAYTWVRLEASARPTAGDVESALSRGGCPFQREVLCGVHAIRPLGCRVYFCDETAVSWQEQASERYLRDLRELHDHAGLPYHYAEWRAMLRAFAGVAAGDSARASLTPGSAGSFGLSSSRTGDTGRGVGLTVEGRVPTRPEDEEQT